MKLRDVTALGRPIELDVPTNRAIMVVSAAVVLLGTGLQLTSGLGLPASALWGVVAGASGFLAWAIARELDPDRDYAAFLAAAAALLAVWLLPRPNFAALLWVLLLQRVLNRSTGLRATWIDASAILGLTAWLTWQWSWVFGVVSAAALVLDARLSDPQARHRWFAVGCLAVAGAAYLSDPALRSTVPMSRELLWGILGATACFLAALFGTTRVNSIGDDTGAPLDVRRLQVMHRITLLGGYLVVLRHGDAGIIALAPLWAAVFGVGAYRIVTLGRGR